MTISVHPSLLQMRDGLAIRLLLLGYLGCAAYLAVAGAFGAVCWLGWCCNVFDWCVYCNGLFNWGGVFSHDLLSCS